VYATHESPLVIGRRSWAHPLFIEIIDVSYPTIDHYTIRDTIKPVLIMSLCYLLSVGQMVKARIAVTSRSTKGICPRRMTLARGRRWKTLVFVYQRVAAGTRKLVHYNQSFFPEAESVITPRGQMAPYHPKFCGTVTVTRFY
jgi:hypothetical protein